MLQMDVKLVCGLLFLFAFDSLQAIETTDETEVELSDYVPPKAIEPTIPSYPKAALKYGKEAWVVLQYMVDRDGTTYDISVLDSLGGIHFERAAVNALEKTTFVPATYGGKITPVRRQFKYTFQIEGPHGTSGSFRARYVSFQKSVSEEDQEAADKKLENLEKYAKNLYEFSWLAYAQFFYQSKWGTPRQQLIAITNAIAYEPNGGYLPEEIFIAALAKTFVLQVQLQYFQSALSTYKTFLEQGPGKSQFESTLEVYATKVLEIKENRTPFALNEQLEGMQRWHYSLLWNTFAIETSETDISNIHLHCDRESFVFKFVSGMEYDVGGDPGECMLFLEVPPNTTLTLYQL